VVIDLTTRGEYISLDADERQVDFANKRAEGVVATMVARIAQLSLLAALSAVVPIPAADAPPATQLTRDQVTDISALINAGDMRPLAFRARAGRLYFLFSSPSGSHTVAIANANGKLIGTTPVPVIQAVGNWIDVDPRGNIILRRIQKGPDAYFERVFKINPSDGKEILSFDVRPGFLAATMVGARLAGVSKTDLIIFDENGRLEKTIRWKAAALLERLPLEERSKHLFVALAALDSKRVAVFQRLDLQADIFDLDAGRKDTAQIGSATLRDLMNTRHPLQNGRTTLIDSVASQHDGTVYASIGQWDPRIGVSVVRVNAKASEMSNHVCGPLAAFETFKNSTNPDGFMHPHETQVDGHSLLVYDQRGALIRCALPTP
jgi:hypothetical protein